MTLSRPKACHSMGHLGPTGHQGLVITHKGRAHYEVWSSIAAAACVGDSSSRAGRGLPMTGLERRRRSQGFLLHPS